MIAYGRCMRLAILFVLLGCGGTTTPPSADVCGSLDRNTCLASDTCSLVHVAEMQYECRAESGTCEVGHKQDDQAGCEKRAGCRFDPGSCYCPCKGYGKTTVEDRAGESCKCECGGGPPPTCVAESAPPSRKR